ncbi:adenylate kinase, partial [Candidatus Bathyarchaeota archaeon]|nr:adenylate kinase [Candidatus Bathyarchaeota archaeon]
MGRVFFLTGRPGIGKTTVLLRIVKILKEKGLKVGG